MMLDVSVSLGLEAFRLEARMQLGWGVTGIFGASGAGKTTLLETIAGLRPRAEGVLRYDGELWSDSTAGIHLPPEARRCGYAPQEAWLIPHKTVAQNLAMALRAARGSTRVSADGKAEQMGAEFLQMCEIEGLRDRYPASLSGGEQQRVALARALCSMPRLILLDEPFASVDLARKRRLIPRLRSACAAVPTLLVSHDPLEVLALCDSVVVMAEGAVIRHGDACEVLAGDEPGTQPHYNALHGTVVDSGSSLTRVRLRGAGGYELTVNAEGFRPGESVMLGIRPGDLHLISGREIQASTANLVPCRVATRRRAHDWPGSRELVELHAAGSGDTLRASVPSRGAAGGLDLSQGSRLHALLPAEALRVYPLARQRDHALHLS
jgi:molybdate transport system ATP-binding protein